MTKRRGKAKHQPNPPRDERHPGVNLYRIKSPKVYSSYPYTSYEPHEVGCFQTDIERNVLPCSSDMFPRFESNINLPIDLNEGLEEYYERKGMDSNRLASSLPLWQRFLKWIIISDFDLSSVDFIARRGILKYIGHTLYDFYKTPWMFKVCKYNGKIYMYEPTPEDRCKSIVKKDPQCRKYMYWGKKFEDTVTSSKEESSGSYRMVRSNVGKYKVLLGAEVDAVRVQKREESDDVVIEKVLQGCSDCSVEQLHCQLLNRCRYYSSDNATEFIEIKTCVKRQVKNKTSFGWLQSYLAGVKTLIFGFRDNEGLVHSMEEYNVKEVPLKSDWDGGAMFGLISGVLNWLHQHVDEGCSGTLQYCGAERHAIEFRKNDHEGHFLPDWFTKHLLSKENRMKSSDLNGSFM